MARQSKATSSASFEAGHHLKLPVRITRIWSLVGWIYSLFVVITIVYNSAIVNYSYHMAELIKTEVFDRWLSGLRDRNAMARIMVRLSRLAEGNPGDVKPVGGGISELRVNYGPGYRVYYMQRGAMVVVLLCGGDKRTQTKDIKEAKALAEKWKD